MELLSVQLARSIWIFPIVDLNPKGKSLYPILPFLIDLYKFKKFPSVEEASENLSKGLKFEHGEFTNDKGDLILVDLTIYPDGLIVDTRSSTKDSDAFLTQILTRLNQEYGLVHYEGVIRKINYVSQLNVRMQKSLELLNPKLKEISDYLTQHVSGHDNVPFEVGKVAFWPDQIKPVNPSPFNLGRTANTPFSENRYFSVSPLETEQHLELLQRLEDLL